MPRPIWCAGNWRPDSPSSQPNCNGTWRGSTIPMPIPSRPPARCSPARCAIRTPIRWGADSPLLQSNSPWPATPDSTPPHHRLMRAVYGVFTAGYVPATEVEHVAVHADGTRVAIPPAPETLVLADVDAPPLPAPLPAGPDAPPATGNDRRGPQWRQGRWCQHRRVGAHRCPLALAGQHPHRRTGAGIAARRQRISRSPGTCCPAIRAVNFVIDGILGKGVAYQARFDPQAKGLGEWLRSRHVDIPEEIL